MKLNVVWSPTARSEYSQLLAYIEGEWGLEAVLDFMEDEKLLKPPQSIRG